MKNRYHVLEYLKNNKYAKPKEIYFKSRVTFKSADSRQISFILKNMINGELIEKIGKANYVITEKGKNALEKELEKQKKLK